MPQKTPRERARIAKARGTTMTQKRNDVEDTGARSNHANKKSRGIIRRKGFADRTVKMGSAPGEGRVSVHQNELPVEPEVKNARARLVPDAAASRFRKSGRKKVRSLDRGDRPVARVEGRKKQPSRLNVKSKGGPRKRLRIHGG